MQEVLRFDTGRIEVRSWLPIVFCLIGLLLQGYFISRLEINWDEFFFLAHVHEYLRGTLDKPLQTFHVHGFTWLVRFGDEVEQVITARVVMLLFESCTAALIASTARRFVTPGFALIGALAYLTSGFVFIHGVSFRADPIVTFLLMLALHIVLTQPLRAAQLGVAAIALAVAALVSIKAALYLPALVAAAAYRMRGVAWRGIGVRFVFASVFALAVGAVLYVWHDAQLAASVGKAKQMAAEGLNKTLLESALLPRSAELMEWILLSLPQLALILAGVFAAITKVRREGVPIWPVFFLIIGLISPMLSVLVYRNAFPYYFPFAAAPAMIIAAIGAAAIGRKQTVLAGICALMGVGLAFQFVQALYRPLDAQRVTVAAVHTIFPTPVAYIDRNSMIASFPKHGIFMSTWGLEAYRAAGQPIFRKILETAAPAFVLANSPTLESALTGRRTERIKAYLSAEDAQVLRENYIPYWGVIWIAGKCVDAATVSFDIRVPGLYRLVTNASVEVDGKTYRPDDLIRLGGNHQMKVGRPGTVCLRWADAHPAPTTPPPAAPIYRGF